MVVTDQDVLVSRLSAMFEKLGLDEDEGGCADIGRAIRSETQMLEERHGKRLSKLEEQTNQIRVNLAEVQGRMDNIKTGIEGDMRLFNEMLSILGEKLERIEKNTSKEQSVRRGWMIALIAAVPGLVSVILNIIDMAVQ